MRVRVLTALVALLLFPRTALAYSVITHEVLIDTAWETDLVPVLRARFPNLSADAVRRARAYAYGGSLIQDLGYYPFGSRFFSNLVHYVRSGDFIAALIRESRDADEYAFALGALAHYACDNAGHSLAVNRAVPMLYPKLREKYGPEVLYAQSPTHHVMAEFAFDVLEVARGAFKADVYQSLVGFEVSRPVLERAFRATYGLEVKDVFGDVDLAIGTYRWAVSKMIPDATRLAWRDKREEIVAATPNIKEADVVFTMSRQEFEKAFGTKYRKPGLFARIVVGIFKIVPRFGPFKPLAFTPLTPDTERLFRESFAASHASYRDLLRRARQGSPAFNDTDFDTGKRPVRGINRLADDTFGDLLEELEERKFASVPAELQQVLNGFFGAAAGQRDKKLSRRLAALNSR